MPGCIVYGCKNHTRKVQQIERHISYHRFPSDKSLLKLWLSNCGLRESINVSNARVCLDHFQKEDFKRDFKSELLNLKPVFQLKSNAIPYLEIPSSSKAQVISDEAGNDSSLGNKDQSADFPVLNAGETNTQTYLTHSDASIQCELEDESKLLKIKNQALNAEVSRLKTELSESKYKITALTFKVHEFEKLFSDCQKNVISKGKCLNWSSEDISKAVTLRSLSRKAYYFVRDILKYPLPSEITIKRRLSKLVVRPGLIDISINIIKSHVSVFTDFEKDVILLFDEMRVKSDLCYDPIDDIIQGPHTNVQVLIIRSLVGKWKQPIYYEFDKSVDKKLFFEVIEAVESTGFRVRGFVCDMGGSNRKLFTELGVKPGMTSIQNPRDTSRRIWAFSDVPHMLKLLRNHLLDEGFILSDGKIVKKEVLETLIDTQQGDLQFTYKVTRNHLLVSGPERQNVRKAVELLSGTVGTAIKHLQPQNAYVGDFITTVNDGFDVLNSRFPNHQSNALKSAYGINIIAQNVALNKLECLCSSMRVIGKKDMLPFQKGFITSIQSIQGLYAELKGEGYSYLMTARCNQDALESYFSLIRGLGHFYDHPLPVDVTRRIKSLLLTKNNATCVMNSMNVQREKDESVTLSADLISECVSEERSDEQSQNSSEETKFDQLKHNFKEENEFSGMEETLSTERKELLKVLAGYVAYRVKKKNINSTFEYGHITGLYPSTCSDWLSAISKGRLINPTPEWLNIVEQMEVDFNTFHGQGELSKMKGITTKLAKLMKSKYLAIDEFAIICFVRTRTFIRMKRINKNRGTKRKFYGDKKSDRGRQVFKKMNKLQ